jgi:hypothetical protein
MLHLMLKEVIQHSCFSEVFMETVGSSPGGRALGRMSRKYHSIMHAIDFETTT